MNHTLTVFGLSVLLGCHSELAELNLSKDADVNRPIPPLKVIKVKDEPPLLPTDDSIVIPISIDIDTAEYICNLYKDDRESLMWAIEEVLIHNKEKMLIRERNIERRKKGEMDSLEKENITLILPAAPIISSLKKQQMRFFILE